MTQLKKTEADATTLEPRRQIDWVAPPVDIYESKDEFLIIADVPGVTQNDVRIDYERGRIEFTAHGKPSVPEGRLVGGVELARDYRRAFSVPGTIDVDKIAAELKAGVLFLRLPKSERAKPRQIQVKSS